MKFYVDEDVDVAVRSMLVKAGHEAWSTVQSGKLGDSDNSQVAYAIERDAVLVTHDAGIIQRQRQMPIGRVIRLKCHEEQAPDVLRARLDDLVPILESHRDLFVVVSRTSSGAITHELIFGTEPDSTDQFAPQS